MAKRELSFPVLDELLIEVPSPKAPPRAPEMQDWDKLFDLISDGTGIREACLELGLHYRTVSYRIRADERLQREHIHAKAAAADVLAEDAIALAYQTKDGLIEPGAAKVAAGIMQWGAGQKDPKTWGQSTIRQEITGKDGKDLNPVVIFALPDNARSIPMRNITPKIEDDDSSEPGSSEG